MRKRVWFTEIWTAQIFINASSSNGCDLFNISHLHLSCSAMRSNLLYVKKKKITQHLLQHNILVVWHTLWWAMWLSDPKMLLVYVTSLLHLILVGPFHSHASLSFQYSLLRCVIRRLLVENTSMLRSILYHSPQSHSQRQLLSKGEEVPNKGVMK